jgi:hypothetical protein
MFGSSKSDFASFTRYGLGGFIPSRYRQNAAPQQDKATQAVVVKLCEDRKNQYSRDLKKDSDRIAALTTKISVLETERNQSKETQDAKNAILAFWKKLDEESSDDLSKYIEGIKTLPVVSQTMKDKLVRGIEDRIKVVAGFDPWKSVMEKWNIRLGADGNVNYDLGIDSARTDTESSKMKTFILKLRIEVVEPFCKPVKDYRGVAVTPESFDLKIKQKQKELELLQERKKDSTSYYEEFQKSIKKLFGRNRFGSRMSGFTNRSFSNIFSAERSAAPSSWSSRAAPR